MRQWPPCPRPRCGYALDVVGARAGADGVFLDDFHGRGQRTCAQQQRCRWPRPWSCGPKFARGHRRFRSGSPGRDHLALCPFQTARWPCACQRFSRVMSLKMREPLASSTRFTVGLLRLAVKAGWASVRFFAGQDHLLFTITAWPLRSRYFSAPNGTGPRPVSAARLGALSSTMRTSSVAVRPRMSFWPWRCPARRAAAPRCGPGLAAGSPARPRPAR